MVLLDRSGSLNASNPCRPFREAAAGLIRRFREGTDRAGLILFSSDAAEVLPMTDRFREPAATALSGGSCRGWTDTNSAFDLAVSRLSASSAEHLRVILIITDGQPSTLTLD
jgi:Mg-chelatase subunit ChlD